MEVHIVLKRQPGNINDSTKRPKPKENYLGIFGISARELMHFARNSSEALGSRRERCRGYVSIYKNIPKKFLHLSPKSCGNFTQWFKEGHSWSIVVTQLRLVSRLHVTLQALMYTEGNDRTSRPIWNYATGTLTS